MHIIGRGRYAREAYPSPPNAATGALRNRNVANNVTLASPYTPAISFIAAVLFTPKVSGVIQMSANVVMTNDVAPDSYALVTLATPGTGLNITGGTSTIDGWVMGSLVPPSIGGVLGAPTIISESTVTIAASAEGTLLTFGFLQLPVGIPVVVVVAMASISGGTLAGLAILNLSVLELP